MTRKTIIANLLVGGALWGQSATTASSEDKAKPSAEMAPRVATANPEAEIVKKWGVRVSALRLTAADMMLDLRIRVLDLAKAESLFTNKDVPVLINPATGHRLEVPNTPTMGRLRPTRISEANRDYAIIFGNAFRQVRHGDKVKVQIGEFQADVTVE